MTATTIAVWVLVWVVCGLGSAWLADRKGMKASNWLWAGLLLGPLGLIITSRVEDEDDANLWGGAERAEQDGT
jgi:hypothetical protein